MGILKKIFRNKKEVVEDIVVEEEDREPQEGDLICSQCNMAIHPGQKIKTFSGKKMHMKPCWFKLRKLAKSYM